MHYLQTMITPHQVVLGYLGSKREPIYASCAKCGTKDAVIHGAITGEDDRVCVMPVDGGPFFNPCYYCDECWKALIASQTART
jgi:hypothetical protein